MGRVGGRFGFYKQDESSKPNAIYKSDQMLYDVGIDVV